MLRSFRAHAFSNSSDNQQQHSLRESGLFGPTCTSRTPLPRLNVRREQRRTSSYSSELVSRPKPSGVEREREISNQELPSCHHKQYKHPLKNTGIVGVIAHVKDELNYETKARIVETMKIQCHKALWKPGLPEDFLDRQLLPRGTRNSQDQYTSCALECCPRT